MKVFVVDSEGRPCLPTKPRRARQLLDQGRAVVKQVVPFTIQLKRKIDNPVGSFEMGVDDGAKHVGIAVKNTKTNEIIFTAQVDHRQDVSRKVEQRKNYRKSRRFRLRNRQPRFDNRTSKGKLAPSIRQRKEVIVRVLKDMKKRLNIVKVVVEEVFFNHAEHIWGKWFSLVEIGKNFLKNEIANVGCVYDFTRGYITKETRVKLGLSKRHSNDACSILNSNKIDSIEYFIKPKRSRRLENHPTRTCEEKNGFKRMDLIRVDHKRKGNIIGSIRSLKSKRMTIRTRFDDNFSVGYKNSKLLQRFNGLIYSY